MTDTPRPLSSRLLDHADELSTICCRVEALRLAIVGALFDQKDERNALDQLGGEIVASFRAEILAFEALRDSVDEEKAA